MSHSSVMRRVWLLAVTLHCSAFAHAADRAPLTQGQDLVTAPSVGRVVLVFVIISAIAVALIVALRRYLPQFGGPMTGAGQIRVIDRAALLGGARVHLVEIGEQKLVVAESRNGIAITLLSGKAKATNDAAI